LPVFIFGTRIDPGGTAFALALGIAIAHVIAKFGGGVSLAPARGGQLGETRKLVTFGWPLMLSFGVGAFSLGPTVFSARGGAAAVGLWSLSDLVERACLYRRKHQPGDDPLAKKQFVAGDIVAARNTLTQAFKLLLVTAGF